MEFKELFGSFMGHWVENWSIETRFGSTGSVGSEKTKDRKREPVADGLGPVGDALLINPSATFRHIQSIRPSADYAFFGARRRRGQTRRRRVVDSQNVNSLNVKAKLVFDWYSFINSEVTRSLEFESCSWSLIHLPFHLHSISIITTQPNHHQMPNSPS
ncbi:hypothetical protein Hdeb2414_s0011g00360381 [Helianthus debilis subsp. tardiflorus]